MFKKTLLQNFGKTSSSRQWFCFSLYAYSPPNMGNITCSRISFGICTFAMVNLALKRNVSSWAQNGFSWEKSRPLFPFFRSQHSECLHSNVWASQTIPAETVQYGLEGTFKKMYQNTQHSCLTKIWPFFYWYLLRPSSFLSLS